MDDQSRYWIQKGGTCLNSHGLSSFGDSWEEQAFAEDAAGPLGGCIWPPRSYTCSFCRREFRSAQALGGHMNVHRRDRARLKQISSPNNNSQNILEPNMSSLGKCVLQNPNEICSPNFDLDHNPLFSSSGPRPSSTFPINRPFTTHSVNQEQQKCTSILSWSKFESRKRFQIDDLGRRQDNSFTKVLLESNISTNSQKINDHPIEVNFNNKRKCETPIFKYKDDADDDSLIFKRRRIDHEAQSIFPKDGDASSESRLPLKRSPNSTLEYLDLELRLGDRP